MSTSARRPLAAVVGGQSASPETLALAKALGQALIEQGLRVATGGLGGVMSAASQGAREAPGWREGDVIGVLPGLDASTANPYVDVAVPTGLNYARNTVLVAMGDVVIAIGGGAGTLSEIALAWQHNKPVIALLGTEGWGSRLAGAPLDARRTDVIHGAESPHAAAILARSLVGSREVHRGF